MFQQLRIVWPVLLLAGCSGGPSSLPSTPSTPAVPTAAVAAVMVTGTAPALGESSQFTATATFSNGRTEDVTAGPDGSPNRAAYLASAGDPSRRDARAAEFASAAKLFAAAE